MNNKIESNPFFQAYLNKSWGPNTDKFDQCIDFTQIQVQHYLPAIDHGITLARENIKKIKSGSETPTFENTVVALENSSELLEMVNSVFSNLYIAEGSPELQALAKEIAPKNAAFSNELMLDAELFAKVKSIFQQMPSLKLDDEQKMLVEKMYKNFARNGALLSDGDKEKLKAIDQELSVLAPHYSENVLKATNDFTLVIDDRNQLAGLPNSVIEAAAHEAEKKGLSGRWLFSLQAPSLVPFLQYCENRELRKQLWTAYNSRAFNDKFDNQENILKTIRLKSERAKLLGFKSHAEFTLTERMAETPTQVMKFLDQLLAATLSAAKKDLQELKDFRKGFAGAEQDEIMPWDFAYYSEKLKEKKYSFNQEELRPYFKLENVVNGIFEHARKLYDLEFRKLDDAPKYHADVDVYEVTEVGTKKYIGLFYTDFFPRESKQGGAWMTNFREQGFMLGQIRRPHVSIVCNFTKPIPSRPSLLSYDEVLTTFHEFGHALHSLLTQCHFRSLSGANVYWDFVELPSQIMENWVKEKEGLDLFAKHYETQESLPHSIIEKIKKANQFQAGYRGLRQLNFAFLDMLWHSTAPEQIKNVSDFELKATEKTRLFPYVPGTNSSCSFSHIFSGGYSAGYYSYKWAEVLDADAFEAFKEKGIFNRETSSKFKNNILARGGTAHPMTLYKNFRSREPDPKALLRRDGLI